MVRQGYVAAFSVPPTAAADTSLVIIAERASGTRRADPAAGDRRHPRGRLRPTRGLGRRRPLRACRRPPPHDERQAGASARAATSTCSASSAGCRAAVSTTPIPGWSVPLIFVAGAVSQYLGAAIGVVMFDTTEPSTVAWLRAAAAGAALLLWRRPWRSGNDPARRLGGDSVRSGDDRDERRVLRGHCTDSAWYRRGRRVSRSSRRGGTQFPARSGRRGRRYGVRGVVLLAGCRTRTSTRAGSASRCLSAALWAGYILLGKRVADSGDGPRLARRRHGDRSGGIGALRPDPAGAHRFFGLPRFADVVARRGHRPVVHGDPLCAGSSRAQGRGPGHVRVAARSAACHGDRHRHRRFCGRLLRLRSFSASGWWCSRCYSARDRAARRPPVHQALRLPRRPGGAAPPNAS